ncbi:capsular polysaccharide biosynthesis protein [Polaribacter irgensii 23-P]|uniref:Capsular polysaccharide biosynthesis protein n=1 Tax=Polaribacter irgensii 23-P TaxID=313594 RepID=A4C1F5_9FLAO|nr:oligosaccharide flippase family protein [Polaribacter irgensii]EAR11958.1 capsular polysaccharide biosynthesis protein [Polaribacter irgensii 23-P]
MSITIIKRKVSSEQIFMITVFVVNGGNYLYNLVLARILGPSKFADVVVLITFLLTLSFIAMTFQLVTAKFSILFSSKAFQIFVSIMYRSAMILGIFIGILIMLFSNELQELLITSSASMFVIFGIGVPLYFVMSINRGIFQGKKQFQYLSITYLTEMLSRLLITFGLVFIFDMKSAAIIAFGIVISFGFGMLPFKYKAFNIAIKLRLQRVKRSQIKHFFLLTAFYELTQIIINNSDVLLVKHYFEPYNAGLYASLALIGRVVYFVAWMFVMLLLPQVIELKKEGKSTHVVLFKYIGYITFLSCCIVLSCFCYPETIVYLLFGDNYLEISPLLWKYALATSLFAVSNIFAYYYLSLDKYIPVVISGVFGMLQFFLIIWFHESLNQVVQMQIFSMFVLLIVQILWYLKIMKFDGKF